jgi:hypothetical protein
VLYGTESWGLTFREGHRLKVFKNRELSTVYGLDLTKHCRKLHNEKLHDLCSSPTTKIKVTFFGMW